MYEFMLTLFRLEERARAFFLTTIVNVLATIALTVVLVVGLDEGARGLLLGSYAAGAAFVLAPDRRPAAPPLAPLRPRRCCAACSASACRRCPPRSPSTCSTSSTGSSSSAPLGARRGRALLAGGQVRAGGQRPRPRLPARLAAARLLDPRRRRGPPRLRHRRHPLRRRLRLRRHRHVAVLALDRPRPRRAEVLRLLRSGRPDLRRGHPLRALHGDGRDPRQHRPHRVQPPGRARGPRSPTSPSTWCWCRRWGSSAPASPWSAPTWSSSP